MEGPVKIDRSLKEIFSATGLKPVRHKEKRQNGREFFKMLAEEKGSSKSEDEKEKLDQDLHKKELKGTSKEYLGKRLDIIA